MDLHRLVQSFMQKNDPETTNSKMKDIVVTQKLTLKDVEAL